jgi:protein-tyrosine phosphatase
MIDLHSHLLPGVDDGSKSIEQSVRVLERFVADGVTVLACTPHLDASRAARAPVREYAERMTELRAAAPRGIDLRLGWEVMLDLPGVDLVTPELCIEGSRAVLVEFTRTSVPARASEELFRLRTSGVIPLLAHPERYWGCSAPQVADWRRVGAVIQTDAAILLDRGSMGRLAHALLAGGLVDMLASDNHGDTRSLLAARRWLEEMGATEQAEVLTTENPRRLLAGEPLLPVAPIVAQRGFMDRLRSLLSSK